MSPPSRTHIDGVANLETSVVSAKGADVAKMISCPGTDGYDVPPHSQRTVLRPERQTPQ
jgi:hypothetical protein